MAALKNISDRTQAIRWGLSPRRGAFLFTATAPPGGVVKDIPDMLALEKISESSQVWAPGDEYTKKLAEKKLGIRMVESMGGKSPRRPHDLKSLNKIPLEIKYKHVPLEEVVKGEDTPSEDEDSGGEED